MLRKLKTNKSVFEYIEYCKTFLSYNTGKTYIKFAQKHIKGSKDLHQVYKSIFALEVKDQTKNTYIAALNNYQKFVEPQAIPFDKIKITGTDKQVPEWFNHLEDIMWSIDAAAGKSAANLALYILARTGLRFGDAPQPKDRIDFKAIEWTDTQQQAIRVKSKGNKYKWVILPPDFKNYSFKELGNVSKSQVNTALKNIFKSVGIEPQVNTHMTRYFFANYNRMIGLSVDEIKRIGGWSSDAVYIYLFDDVEAISELAQFQFLTSIEQIRDLDNKGKAMHYKKLFSFTFRKLTKSEKLVASLRQEVKELKNEIKTSVEDLMR